MKYYLISFSFSKTNYSLFDGQKTCIIESENIDECFSTFKGRFADHHNLHINNIYVEDINNEAETTTQ